MSCKFKKYINYINIIYMSLDLSNNDFNEIIDPETNKTISVNSAVGKQVLKNYIECLRNGPDSENIISTKMYYKESSSRKSSNSSSNNSSNKPSIQDIYNKAKVLSSKQYSQGEINSRIYNKKWIKPRVGKKIYIQRSNKKWQRAIIFNIKKSSDEQSYDVLFNSGSGNVGTKKALLNNNVMLI